MTPSPLPTGGPPAGGAVPAREVARLVARRLRENGHEAFLAGGAVRDLILGRTPKDYDVATSATPDRVRALFPRTVEVGARFGVVVVCQDGADIEVATFRTEESYSDGRRPDRVRFATARDDVLRRDFTINGLLMDPETGEITDWVEGRWDIERRLVRTIGDPADRFAEDRLRMLRAVRLASQLDFSIDPATEEAIRRHAPAILDVSWERIRDELLKILETPRRAVGIEGLRRTGLLAPVLPEVQALAGCPQPAAFHPEGDVFLHTMLVLTNLRDPTPEVALAALLHDVGKPPTLTVADRIRFHGHEVVGAHMADRIARRLRLSNESRERVVELVADHMRWRAAIEMRPSTLKRLLRLDTIHEHLDLYRADCLSSHQDLSVHRFLVERLAHFEEAERVASLRPPPLIGGADLIAWGYAPGPLFGRILHRAEDAQLDGEISTRAEAESLVRREFPPADPAGTGAAPPRGPE